MQKLAEISLEWENLDNAIDLFSKCLELRKAVLDPDDRLIAETYHLLAVAFTSHSELDKAVSCFEQALAILQLKQENLTKSLTNEKLEENERTRIEHSINELQDLVPEIVAKIEDAREQMQTHYKSVAEMMQQDEGSSTPAAASSSDKPVSNISHLIKRKVCLPGCCFVI